MSTVRSAIDGTIDERPLDARPIALREIVVAEWRQSGRADLVHALRRHPVLLRDKSQLLNLAIEEYRANSRTATSSDLEQHCHRFREFGSSVERSIFRQLEAQRYIDSHPELLELFATPEWPKVGDEFGEFQVLEELGVGSAAHVYLCLEADVGFRKVVVKATPFSSVEASILGRLEHKHIVQIYSTGIVDECNLNFLCMPFCGRSTLSDLLDVAFRNGTPQDDDCIATAANQWMHPHESVADQPGYRWASAFRRRSYVDGVLRIAIRIAEALDAAHDQGILHGDLKPSNVLLTPECQPLLLDFNLSQDFVLTPGVCGGTLPYMPPEYLRVLATRSEFTRPTEFSAAPDVYSFGALLYELLTGHTPVNLVENVGGSSATAELILSQLAQGVTKFSRRNHYISRNLESLVLRCLAFDSKERPATMKEVRQCLQRELRSLAAVGRMARLRPVFFASVVGLPLAALAGGGAYIAAQPDRYIASYDQGMRLAAAGKFDEAAEWFTTSVQSNDSFAPARFELGRAQLAIGDFNAALDSFSQLVRRDDDVRSAAYVGYCFNKQQLPVAAIPWYQKAIDKGANSASVYNNLGASYVDARPVVSKKEQFLRAELNLQKALKLDPDSKIVRLNLVRCANRDSTVNRSSDAWRVWRTAWSVLKAFPEDRVVQQEVISWYRAARANSAGSVDRTPTSADENEARHAFETLSPTADLAPADSPVGPAGSLSRGREFQGGSSIHGYFLEPASINIAK